MGDSIGAKSASLRFVAAVTCALAALCIAVPSAYAADEGSGATEMVLHAFEERGAEGAAYAGSSANTAHEAGVDAQGNAQAGKLPSTGDRSALDAAAAALSFAVGAVLVAGAARTSERKG